MKLETSIWIFSGTCVGGCAGKGHRHRGKLVTDKGTKAVPRDKIVIQTLALDQLPTWAFLTMKL